MSYWTLRFDGMFLVAAGLLALVMETLGHFLGIGPLASQYGSFYTIGGFEAHGLAIVLGTLLLREARLPGRRSGHALALTSHVFLGLSTLIFWASFEQLELVPVGVITTLIHAVLAVLQTVCLYSIRWRVPDEELRQV